jgi:hypothetical protein
MRFVAVKTPAQQKVQAVHLVRGQLLKSRTALINQDCWPNAASSFRVGGLNFVVHCQRSRRMKATD